MEKQLKGVEQILNLKEIEIGYQEVSASTSTSHPTAFYFESKTENGYVEDPNLEGYTIEVLDIKRLGENIFLLKVRVKT